MDFWTRTSCIVPSTLIYNLPKFILTAVNHVPWGELLTAALPSSNLSTSTLIRSVKVYICIGIPHFRMNKILQLVFFTDIVISKLQMQYLQSWQGFRTAGKHAAQSTYYKAFVEISADSVFVPQVYYVLFTCLTHNMTTWPGGCNIALRISPLVEL